MGVKKYFIAIVIPEPLQTRIEEIKQMLFKNYNLNGALRSPAHITLHRPFEWKVEKENILIEKLRTFRFDEGFNLRLKDFGFFDPRVIYISILHEQLLFDLQQNLKNFAKKELKLLNEVNDLRGFHPHVTIAFRDLKKAMFYEVQNEFKEKRFEGKFGYEGFSLLKLDKRWEVINLFKIKN